MRTLFAVVVMLFADLTNMDKDTASGEMLHSLYRTCDVAESRHVFLKIAVFT